MKLLKYGFITFTIILALNGLMKLIDYITYEGGTLGPIIAPLVLVVILAVGMLLLSNKFVNENEGE